MTKISGLGIPDPGISGPGGGRRLSEDQRIAWIQLSRTPNVGPIVFRELINYFGSARAAVSGLPELARRGKAARTLRVPGREQAEQELRNVRRMGGELLALGEPGYPMGLRFVDGAPPLIAVRGHVRALTLPAVAIVGARNASLSGRRLASRMATDIGAAGYCVVSGLAYGIDVAAHKGALPTGTVAVFASGIDRVYPREHEALMGEIIDAGGAAVSEMPFGWEPRPRDFPRRNRLISGCSLAVVLVEAAERSGSLHTARFAAEQGRDVLAVPGSPQDPRAAGCNRLIREGATLVRGAEDVLSAVAPMRNRSEASATRLIEENEVTREPPAEPTHDDRSRVIEALGPAPVSIDELIADLDLPARVVQVVLLELELAGRLDRHGQSRISLVMDG